MSVVQARLEGAVHHEWAYLWVNVWVYCAHSPEWYSFETYFARSWAEIGRFESDPSRSYGGQYIRRQLVVEPWTWNAVDGWRFAEPR